MGNCLGILRGTGVRRRLSRRVRPTELQQIQPRPAPAEEVNVAESSSTTSLREPSPSRGDGNDDSVVSKTGVIPAIPTSQGSPQISPTSASSSAVPYVPTGKRKGLSAEPLTPVVPQKRDLDVVAESSKGYDAGEAEGDAGQDTREDDDGGDGGDGGEGGN